MLAATSPSSSIPLSRRWLLTTICLGAFMVTLDTAVVVCALPEIASQLQCSLAQISWVTVIYFLIQVSLLMTIGRLGDLWAPGRLYLFGLLFFTLASFLCSRSQELGWLVGSRALQGVGAALMLGLAPKILCQSLGEQEWRVAFGFQATAHALGFAVGAYLGGIVTAYLGWSYIFYLNIPMCFLAVFLGSRALLVLPTEKVCALRTFDFPGGFLLAGSLGVFLLAITLMRGSEWRELRIVQLLGLSAGLFVLLVFLERRQALPLLHQDLWRNRSFITGILAQLLTTMASNGTFFLIPFFLDQIYHYSAAEVGLLMAVIGMADGLAAPLGGYLAKRYGNLFILRIGSAIILLGLLSLLVNTPETSTFNLARRFFVLGIGSGLFKAPNLHESLQGVSTSLFGLATSSSLVLRQMGSVLGITTIITVFAWINLHHICLRPGFCWGIAIFRNAFLVMILIAALNLLINLIFRKTSVRDGS
jgi:EmrB/QacA subfamily drug resistance transporter